LEEFDADRDAGTAAVLRRFTEDRLLTADEGTVEVALEALLHEWPRLRSWLEEDEESRAVQGHLIAAARQWDTSAGDDAELYRGARLAAALDFSSRHGRHLNELERR